MSSRPRTRRPRTLAAGAAALTVLLLVQGCTDSDDEPERSAEESLSLAAENLAATSGARLTLSTDDLPKGTNGIVGAEGISVAAPAFEGKLTVSLSNTNFEVPVVAVDDKVWAQIPLTQGWSDIDPADYGAPDPSRLLSADAGVGALLEATDDAEVGKTERGGEDNSEILTTYTGTIPGEVMKKVIPSSAGDVFDVTYRVTEEGFLSSVDMTGVFYPDTTEMTYALTVSGYGLERNVTAP